MMFIDDVSHSWLLSYFQLACFHQLRTDDRYKHVRLFLHGFLIHNLLKGGNTNVLRELCDWCALFTEKMDTGMCKLQEKFGVDFQLQCGEHR